MPCYAMSLLTSFSSLHRIRTVIRELFKYMGNNAYDNKKVRIDVSSPVPTPSPIYLPYLSTISASSSSFRPLHKISTQQELITADRGTPCVKKNPRASQTLTFRPSTSTSTSPPTTRSTSRPRPPPRPRRSSLPSTTPSRHPNSGIDTGALRPPILLTTTPARDIIRQRALNESDFPSWHSGILNSEMTEKWRSDRAAEKRKKFRVWSEEGGNRDEDIKEMEAKFPYGFGLVDKELRGLEEGG